MTLVGGDVAEMRSLAARLREGAQRLDYTQQALAGQVNTLGGWRGPDADRFRSEWNSQSSRLLSAAVARLNDAAEVLLRNADQQEQASEAVGVGSSTASFSGGPDQAPGVDIGDILSRILDLGDAGNDLANMANRGLTGIAGDVLSAAGVVTSLTSIAEGIFNGDGVQEQNGWISLGGNALGRIHPALGIAATAATMYGDMTLPTSSEDIDATYLTGAQHLFGNDVDVQNLTPQQADAMSKRYEGPWGVANMISDSMDTKAAEVGRFLGGLFG